MRRARIIIGLTLSAAVALVALIYGAISHQPQDAVKSPLGEVGQVDQTASSGADPNESTVVVPQRANDDIQAGNDHESTEVNEARRNTNSADEASTREWVREETTREVRADYSILLEHLGLTPGERNALLEFLIEDAITNTKTRYSDGIGMDEHERSARIAAIVGDAKLQQLLALERNLGEYRETQLVQSMLQQKDVALTEAQRDAFLKVLIDVREQVDTNLPAHLKPGSMEALEHRLNQIDENDRLALELASSVLSAKQVEYVFERNQAHSYRRADILEWHKQRRADNPEDDLPLGYPPKRD
jgi:hypothetical protein